MSTCIIVIKPMAAPKIAPTTLRFQPHVKEILLLISDQQGRSMANMLEWLIKRHCEHEGMGWPPKDSTARRPRPARDHASVRQRMLSTEHG